MMDVYACRYLREPEVTILPEGLSNTVFSGMTFGIAGPRQPFHPDDGCLSFYYRKYFKRL